MGTGVAPDGTGEGVQGLGRFLENHPLTASGRCGGQRAGSQRERAPACSTELLASELSATAQPHT